MNVPVHGGQSPAANTAMRNTLSAGQTATMKMADVMELTDEVYCPHNFSFGDQWATINFYLNMSILKH